MGRIDNYELRLTTVWLPVLWTLLIVGAFTSEVISNNRLANRLARVEATSSFEKDLVYRKWAAKHGGVYAPVTDHTPPNPYLSHIPERDITTPGGTQLTLINPAYMTRQVHELGNEQYDHKGHITSLKPLNPGNQADEWEIKALTEFETGATEYSGIESINAMQYFRFMQPLITEESCLKCHADQGYVVGDIRGGISISVPMLPRLAETNAHTMSTGMVMGLVWLVGMVGLGASSRITRKAIRDRQESRDALDANMAQLSDSETRYKMLTSMTSDYAASIQVGEDGSLTTEWIVGSFEEITGHKIKMGNPPMLETTHPDDLEQQRSDIAQTLDNKRTLTEFRSMKPDGTYIWVSVARKPIWDEKQQRVSRFILVAQDITKRKVAEVALEESESKFRTLFEKSLDGYGLADPETGLMIECNQALADLVGREPAEIIGLHQKILHPAEQDHEYSKTFEKHVRGIGPDLVATQVITKSGQIKDVEIKANMVQLGEKKLLQGIFRDITQRKGAEKDLLNQKNFLQKAQEIGSIGTWELDLVKNELVWTDENYRIFGVPIGTPLSYEVFLDCVHPEDREYVGTEFEAAFQKKRPYDIEHRILVNEKVKWVREKADLIFDENNECIYATGVTQDITDRKLSEQSRLEFEERYRSVVEDQTEVINRFSPDGTFLFVNDVFCRFFGKAREELLGCKWMPEAHPDDLKMVEAKLASLSLSNPVVVVENRVIAGNKDMRWMEFINRGIFDEGGNLTEIQSVGRDITDRKRVENEMALLEKQLRQTQKLEAIGTLAGGIAHDFNNLLFAILGNASLAAEDIPEDSPAQENISEIEIAGHRAAELVNQILTFARKGEKSVQPINIMLLVKEVAKMLRATLPTTIGIDLRLDAKNTTIVADPTEFHQVVMNLCTNAGQSMMEQGGRLEIGLAEKTFTESDTKQMQDLQEGSYLVLSVCDTGPGIAPDIQDRIFEPFFTTKEAGQGTGMGLAVVHGIVKDLGGEINVYSEVGQGTTFNVYLPLSNLGNLSEDKEAVETPRGTERVLVVDDESVLAKMTKSTLEGLGYTVETANDGKTALEKFLQVDGFDIVVTDQTMPNMTGAELAKQILKTHPNQPIILCTGFSQVIPRERAKEIGIVAYLTKPISRHSLGLTIRQVLDGETAVN